MAWCLRKLTVLKDDLSLVPAPTLRWLTTTYNSTSRGLDTLFQGACHQTYTHTHTWGVGVGRRNSYWDWLKTERGHERSAHCLLLVSLVITGEIGNACTWKQTEKAHSLTGGNIARANLWNSLSAFKTRTKLWPSISTVGGHRNKTKQQQKSLMPSL